jgi:hypothetical protein
MRVVVYKFIISLKIGLLYLHQASEGGITEVGRVLLEHGVDANVRNANATPLLTYIWQGARCSGVRNVVTLNSLLSMARLCALPSLSPLPPPSTIHLSSSHRTVPLLFERLAIFLPFSI